ncbi:MAG: DUF559 domain-containing protein [Beutenbergiaceae bacterium]
MELDRAFAEAGGVLLQRDAPHLRARLSRARAAGDVVAVLPGVSLPAKAAADPRWRAIAVTRWDPDAVVCGELAAQLTFWPELRVSTVTLAAQRTRARSPVGLAFNRRHVPAEWIINSGPLRLTHPALTTLDLVEARGGEAIDRLLRSRTARLQDLWQALDATRHRVGNRARRRLLLDSRSEPWSAAERLAHRLLREAGLAGWFTNHRVKVPTWDRLASGVYYLDIAFPGPRLAIEIDGRAFHGDERFESDRERQNALVLAGWTVLRFTYAMLVERPEDVVRQIRVSLRRAA